MTEEPQVHRVKVDFVGSPAVEQIKRASGVAEVESDGPHQRCVVWGSFQPFLEAMRGREVMTLESMPMAGSRIQGDW
jgi:hypothetical protein